MKKSVEIRQAQNVLKEEMRAILAKAESEKRALSEEEAKAFDEKRDASVAMDKEIARYEAVEEEIRAIAPQKADNKNINAELRQYIKTGDTRALSTTVQADGGYTVVPEVSSTILANLSDASVMRQISNVVVTSTQTYKEIVSTGGAKLGKGTEGTLRTVTDSPTLAEVVVDLNANYALPQTSREIVDFANTDILGWLNTEIVDSFAETEEAEFTNGKGHTAKQASGFLAGTIDDKPDATRDFGTIQKVSQTYSATAAIDPDKLIDLVYSLKAKYRQGAVWVMNSNTAGAVVKIKDKNGQYIWQPSIQLGQPPMLLGYPVYINEAMPGIDAAGAAACMPVAFGNFRRGYLIVDHTSGVQTLPDQISAPGLVKVHTTKYSSGAVRDSRAIKVLEIAKKP